MRRISIAGRQSRIGNGDIRRLLDDVLAAASMRNAEGEATARLLSGGFSGAVVMLVWAPNLEPFIVKAGPVRDIEAEHANRREHGGADSWLIEHQLDAAFGPVEVDDEGSPEQWAAICYRYIGGRSYTDLKDFGDLVTFFRNYVSDEEPDATPSFDSVCACLGRAARLLVKDKGVTAEAAGTPLSRFLPAIRWEAGIESALVVAGSLWADLPELQSFRAWFHDATDNIKVAPVADRRLLHGDARLANFLVRATTADVHLIDYGNSRHGHIFEDLARLEIDLILATARRHPGSHLIVQDDLLATFSLTLLDDLSLADPERKTRHERCLIAWRKELTSVMSGATLPGAAMMYRWFLLCECVRRLRWIGANGEVEAGVDAPSLLRMICALRSRLAGRRPALAPVSTAVDTLRVLHTVAAFVPVQGQERAVNDKRNNAKHRALESAEHRSSSVRLIAETGRSYLAYNGVHYERVSRLLAGGGSLQVVVCNPYFIEARGISLSYEPDHRQNAHPKPVEFHPDFSRKFAEAFQGYQTLRHDYGPRIELRVARFGIAATVLMTDDYLFFEPYFHAERGHRQKLLFDAFELQFSAASLHARRLLGETFDFHWRNSDSVEDLSALEEACIEPRRAVYRLWGDPPRQ